MFDAKELEHNCNTCKNKKICKYGEEMMVALAEARSIQISPDSPITINVSCSSFCLEIISNIRFNDTQRKPGGLIFGDY